MNWCRYTKLEWKVGVGVFIALLWEDCKTTRGLEDQKKTRASTHQCNISGVQHGPLIFMPTWSLTFKDFPKFSPNL